MPFSMALMSGGDTPIASESETTEKPAEALLRARSFRVRFIKFPCKFATNRETQDSLWVRPNTGGSDD